MNNDPLLQELMAEFDEKFLAVESGRGLRVKNIFDGTSRIAKREDLKSFLTSAVLRTREAAAEEEREVILEIIDDGYKSPIKGNIDGETCIGRSRLVEHIRSRQPNQSQ